MEPINPLGNFSEDNLDFAERLFNGTMKTALVVCHHCHSVYVVEVGESEEFLSSYCPFCSEPRVNRPEGMENREEMQERITELVSELPDGSAKSPLVDKVKRIVLHSDKQEFNVAACTVCNNRFILLEEDMDDVANCAFCNASCEEMSALLSYTPQNQIDPNKIGLDKYINCIFFLKLTNGMEDNFILTEVDHDLKRYRFMSAKDGRMAFWIADTDILEMYEFLKAPPKGPEE